LTFFLFFGPCDTLPTWNSWPCISTHPLW
jgi:hypothetical protein